MAQDPVSAFDAFEALREGGRLFVKNATRSKKGGGDVAHYQVPITFLDSAGRMAKWVVPRTPLAFEITAYVRGHVLFTSDSLRQLIAQGHIVVVDESEAREVLEDPDLRASLAAAVADANDPQAARAGRTGSAGRGKDAKAKQKQEIKNLISSASPELAELLRGKLGADEEGESDVVIRASSRHPALDAAEASLVEKTITREVAKKEIIRVLPSLSTADLRHIASSPNWSFLADWAKGRIEKKKASKKSAASAAE